MAFLRQLYDLKLPLKEKLKALDVGGGTGVLRSQVESVTAWDVDVADIDYTALTYVKPGRGRIMYYDVLDRNKEFQEYYDVIILFDVLEHIEQTQLFIEALLFHLKTEGILFVNVPALQVLYSNYDKAQGHYRRYNKRTLLKEFEDSCLILKDIRYWGLLNLPAVVARKAWFMLAPMKDAEEVLSQGFQPPNRLINDLFLTLMRLEAVLPAHPPLGSSVMMAGGKQR